MACGNPRLHGRIKWSMERDRDGHRTYTIQHLVEGDLGEINGDGPFNILNTPGLPLPGDVWLFDADTDLYSTCRPDASVRQLVDEDGEPCPWWIVEQKFSNAPADKCFNSFGTTSFENPGDDPLLENVKFSGGTTRYNEEAMFDRFGDRITNSAHEQMRGPAVEFDANRFTIRVEQNVAALELDIVEVAMDALNDDVMWGFAARTVKLSHFTWEKLWDGQCNIYFKRIFEFEVRTDTFDRDITDEGTKALHGKWKNIGDGLWEVTDMAGGVTPDPSNPSHFVRIQDRYGNLMRCILNGSGVPAGNAAGTTDDPGIIHIEKYNEVNHLSILGLPASIES